MFFFFNFLCLIYVFIILKLIYGQHEKRIRQVTGYSTNATYESKISWRLFEEYFQFWKTVIEEIKISTFTP